MDTPVEQVLIPYEGTFLPGYYYRPDASHQPRPTLMVHGGYDSTGEELYFLIAAAAIQRGYPCLTFEGPGQGALLREQHLPLRPDWEQVVTPVVDFLGEPEHRARWVYFSRRSPLTGVILVRKEPLMPIVNDDHRRRAGVASLDQRCLYCGSAFANYPLLMSDDAGQTVYHVACALELATDLLVDLYTFQVYFCSIAVDVRHVRRDRCWGMLVTTTPGRANKAVFKRHAVWLCSGYSHQWATTNSGRMTVSVSSGCTSCMVSM